MIINAMKQLKPEHIQLMKKQFADVTDKPVIVDVFINDLNLCMSMPIEKLRTEFFMNEDVEKSIADKDIEIDFVINDFILQIAGDDYRWWIAPVRNKKYSRLNKLFSDETVTTSSKSTTKTKQIFKIAVGTMDANNNIVDIKEIEAEKKEATEFVNKEYSIRTLKSQFKAAIVFSINDGNFKTMEELIDEGVFIQ